MIPRCIHGHIILGCPDDKCPTQLAYLDQQQAAMREYRRSLQLPSPRWPEEPYA